jgi:hypothetical protein
MDPEMGVLKACQKVARGKRIAKLSALPLDSALKSDRALSGRQKDL